jgi:hypothetical protein
MAIVLPWNMFFADGRRFHPRCFSHGPMILLWTMAHLNLLPPQGGSSAGSVLPKNRIEFLLLFLIVYLPP